MYLCNVPKSSFWAKLGYFFVFVLFGSFRYLCNHGHGALPPCEVDNSVNMERKKREPI